jgi:hypothetical protein
MRKHSTQEPQSHSAAIANAENLAWRNDLRCPMMPTVRGLENAQEGPAGKKYIAIGMLNIFDAAASVSFSKENFMLNITRSILALCVLTASGAVFAQTGATGATGEGSGAQSGNKDPFVQNREEKGKARKEYKKDKSISKQQYSQEKKAANQKLKQSGAESESTKNLEVPSTSTSPGTR